jgi:hypothetical protein
MQDYYSMIKSGRYSHYKGGTYIVLFTAQSALDDEPMVVYMNEKYGTYYVRSLKDFTVEIGGTGGVPRFKLVEQ